MKPQPNTLPAAQVEMAEHRGRRDSGGVLLGVGAQRRCVGDLDDLDARFVTCLDLDHVTWTLQRQPDDIKTRAQVGR